MPPKIIAYGPEAQRRLDRKNLYGHFHDEQPRRRYIRWARDLMRTMLVKDNPVAPPRNVFQAVFAQYLEARDDFLETLIQHVGNIERGMPQWCGMFAGMIIEEAWDEIVREVIPSAED